MRKKILFLTTVMISIGLLAGCGKSETYNDAMQLYEEGSYEEAMNSFEELGGYKESEEMILACQYAQAKIQYEEGSYEEAISAFEELGDYEDSEEMILACKYDQAEMQYEEGSYEEAISSLEELGDYEDSEEMISACKYAQAKMLCEEEDFEAAIAIYETILEYEDSETKLKNAKQQIMLRTYKDVVALLGEQKAWFYNGGSDVQLNVLHFSSKSASATIQQVFFDGNGEHDLGTSNYEYELDDDEITILSGKKEILSITYRIKKGKLILGDGEYLTTTDIKKGLQGCWTFRYTYLGMTEETNIQIDGKKYIVESASEGIKLAYNEYYYYGPYRGTYTIGAGTLDFGSASEGNSHCDYWEFNVIDKKVVLLQFNHIYERSDGLPGENGYNL